MGATNLFPLLCSCVLPLIGSDTKIDDTEIILDKVLFCGDSEVRCETMGLKAGAPSSARASLIFFLPVVHHISLSLSLPPLIATFHSPLPLTVSVGPTRPLYSPEATISNVFTHNVCLPNIVDEGTNGWMVGWSRSL